MFLFRDRRIPLNKEFRNSLQYIRSVGFNKAIRITSLIGFPFPFFINNLNSYNFALCSFLLKNMTISEVSMTRVVTDTIKELISISCYKGLRHSFFLPVRGQRTRTNAGTRRYLRSHKEKILWK